MIMNVWYLVFLLQPTCGVMFEDLGLIRDDVEMLGDPRERPGMSISANDRSAWPSEQEVQRHKVELDKYLVHEETVKMVECRTTSDQGYQGWFDGMKDSVVWLGDVEFKVVEGMECRDGLHTKRWHEYCDATNKKKTMCRSKGKGVKKNLIRSFGKVGQDCGTWESVVAYHQAQDKKAKRAVMASLKQECKDNTSQVKRRLAGGCEEDTFGGTDKDWGVGGFDSFWIFKWRTGFTNNGNFHLHFHNTPDVIHQPGYPKNKWTYKECNNDYTNYSTFNRPHPTKFIGTAKVWAAWYKGKKKASQWSGIPTRWPTIHTGDKMTGHLAFTGVHWREHDGFNDCDLVDFHSGVLLKCDNQYGYVNVWAKFWNSSPAPKKRDLCNCI